MFRKLRLASQAIVFLASLLLGGFANAQSSVTLFGVIDGGLLYTSKTLNAQTGANAGKQLSVIDGGSSYSQFGLIGSEDLGGGLTAKFKLESAFSIANGGIAHCNGNLFGCEAWVSLDSRYGELKGGLQFSPFFLALYESDPRGMSFFGSGGVNLVDNLFGTGIFSASSVSYKTPNLWGLQATMLYSFGGQAGDFQAGRQYAASLKYEYGGFMINAAIFDGNSGGANQTPTPTTLAAEGRTLGAAFKFGALTAKASFVNYKVAGSFNNNVYGGGLSWYVLPTLDLDGGIWVTSDRNHTANHSLLAALGASYYLSKRTTLYAQVATVNNHGAMNTGLSVNGALFSPQGTTVGATLGIRHSF
ncbi:porin [Paraburkholderia hospita]|uniref:porin n=1 Tax=Paraburkholderia hospita TaxID=169430 RepID=UPI0009A8FDBF|nr:porin [Paraburkholderia hospita]SKC93385.1 Outer membrane protein (porin) [Paraburkholderia hospita]